MTDASLKPDGPNERVLVPQIPEGVARIWQQLGKSSDRWAAASTVLGKMASRRRSDVFVGVEPTVPNVVGMKSAHAEKALKHRGFSTKRATQLWRSAKADEVIGQTPAGQKVAPQSEVTYLVALPKPCSHIVNRHIEGNGAWVDFRLLPTQDGESKSWSNGNHWQYGPGACTGLPEYQLERHQVHLP